MKILARLIRRTIFMPIFFLGAPMVWLMIFSSEESVKEANNAAREGWEVFWG